MTRVKEHHQKRYVSGNYDVAMDHTLAFEQPTIKNTYKSTLIAQD